MPASRAATAICSAPFECPSRPGLPTRIRGGPPNDFASSWTWRAHREHVVGDAGRDPADAGRGPVLAEHVAQRIGPFADGPARRGPARSSRPSGSRRFRPRPAGACSASSTAAESRSRRHSSSRAICSASAAGSSTRMCDSPSRLAVSGDGSVSVKQLTPTTFVSPDSIRRIRSALDCTSRPLISSIISNAPPPSSTHCSSSHAAVESSSTFASIDLRALEDVAVLQEVASRTRAPAACAATTAGPRAGAARAPRSSTAAAARGPARRARA